MSNCIHTAYGIVNLYEWSWWMETAQPPRPLIESDNIICCIHTI